MVDIIDNCCLTEIRINWQEQSSVGSANYKPITLLRESKYPQAIRKPAMLLNISWTYMYVSHKFITLYRI
jgi:hypothetical protein